MQKYKKSPIPPKISHLFIIFAQIIWIMSRNFIILCTFMAVFASPLAAQEVNDSTSQEEETTAASSLQMPNAFSPNGDGINDIYKPKDGYQNISEFHAYIYNRWGQKLFDWTDPSTGWDGTYRGKPVKDGVYFCLVKAKGTDGKTYNIKRDVNLLRGYTETTTTNE